MEILQILLSFFLKELGGETLTPILEKLKNNDFDLKKTLNGLNLQNLAPIVSAIMQSSLNKNRPTENAERNFSLSPISGIADKDIIYTLNKYFCNF